MIMDEKDINVINLIVENPHDSEGEDEVDALPKRNPFIRGSDPRVATCRGRLQTKRCQLNQDINKELRLRAGAENLFKATTNRKLRETVALELSFVNSNLQLLKEQLAELNSSVEIYQNDCKDSVIPMIPLGLKETKEVDFREPFRDFILEHYSEDAKSYEEPLNDFMDMRQAMRTPSRSSAGVSLLFKYYNQLYFIERRFFPPDRSLGIYFEWFDSLTGVPSCQRTVAFEKACVLYNMAGIYTQIGAKQDRLSASGLDGAVDALLRAAGTLRYIHENFTNAPSVDLSSETLQVLVALMMAQARECLFEKLQLQAKEECLRRDLELCDDLDLCIDLCQESAHLSVAYQELYDEMQSEAVLRYMPYTWVSLVHVKTEFYKGLAHHYLATGVLNSSAKSSDDRLISVLADWPDWRERCKDALGVSANKKDDLTALTSMERNTLGKSCLQEAVTTYEEACRLQRMCRELRAKEALSRVLREKQERAHKELATLDSESDFTDLLDAPQIIASTKFQLSLTPPDFAQHRVEDLFKKLGPIAVFSARRHWTAPRLVQLQRNGRKTRKPDMDRRERIEKRDKSEDNSSYYILKNDLYERDLSKKMSRCSVTKPNGMYVNPYSKNILESYVKTSTENGIMKLESRGIDKIPLHRKESLQQRESLRRVSSEYNVNGKTDLEDGFGFSVRGDSPVIINSVEPNSLADLGGVRPGDIIVGVAERDVKWRAHADVVRLIRDCGDTVALRLVTPVAQQAQHPISPVVSKQSSRGGSLSSSSSGSGNSSGRGSGNSSGKRSGSLSHKNGLPTRVPSWNPFKRIERKSSTRNSNVVYR